MPLRIGQAQLWSPLLCISKKTINRSRSCNLVGNYEGNFKVNFSLQPMERLDKNFSFRCGLFSTSYGLHRKVRKCAAKIHKLLNYSEKFKQRISILFVRLVVGVILVTSISVAVSETPSCKFVFP